MEVDMQELIENETNKYAKRFYEKLVEESYILEGEGRYLNSKTHVDVKCPKGHTYNTTPDNFNSGYRCRKCAIKTMNSDKKETQQDFEKRVFDLTKGEYIVQGKYINARTNIKLIHGLCGYSWDVRPDSFLNRGSRCPRCQKVERVNTQEFGMIVNDIGSGDFILIGDYVNNRTLVKLKCKKCKCIHSVLPLTFTKGSHVCPKCHNKEQTEIFKKTVESGGEYELIGGYKSSKKHTKVKHLNCGSVWEVTPHNFIHNKTRCPICWLANLTRSTQEYKKIVYKQTFGEYRVLSNYVNARTHIEMRHEICGYEWKVVPDSFLRGHRCPKCAAKNRGLTLRKTHEDFKKEFISLMGKEYDLLSEYTTNSEKVQIRHNTCGYSYLVTPKNIFNGRRCPKCNLFKGESKIYQYLHNLGLDFSHNSTIKNKIWLINNRFDFYIGEFIVIEYDGEGHFYPIDFAGKGEEWSIKNHKEYIERDQIKNQYCIDNNIPLIRIPYWEFDNTEYILENALKYFNIIEGECENPSIVEKYYVRDGWCHDTYISWNNKENR